MRRSFQFCALTTITVLAVVLGRSNAAQHDRDQASSFAPSAEGLEGHIRLGELHLSNLVLPVELIHQVQETIFGPISLFRIAPFDTYVAADPDDAEWVRWLSPLGYQAVFPKPLLGVYEAQSVRVEERRRGAWQMRYASGLCVRYSDGALESIVSPDGQIFACRSSGRWVHEIQHDGKVVARFERSPRHWTVQMADGDRSIRHDIALNDLGQIISYHSPGLSGNIDYDAAGLLASVREGNVAYQFQSRRPSFLSYQKRSNPTCYVWTVHRKTF